MFKRFKVYVIIKYHAKGDYLCHIRLKNLSKAKVKVHPIFFLIDELSKLTWDFKILLWIRAHFTVLSNWQEQMFPTQNVFAAGEFFPQQRKVMIPR